MTTPASDCFERIEGASRDELTALQHARLRSSIALAFDKVAAYRAKCEAAGVRPGDYAAPEDLARFPFTTKDDLRLAYPYGAFAVPREQVLRIHASSGTTGKPTIVGYTRADLDTWSTLMARSLYATGVRPGDVVHNGYGYGLFTGGLGLHMGAEWLRCTCIPMSGGMTERQVLFIRDLEPDVLTVTPSYALTIADEFERQGLDAGKTSLRIGVHGAEPWTESMRAEIERRFDMQALNIYGLSEILGPGVAAECAETKDGLTLWEDHFYPEIIDPDTGEVLPDGAFGELVLTTLTKEALPMIRYRTRDLTRLLPPSARSMRRIERITGRSDDMLIIRGINVFPTQIEEVILKRDDASPHYVLELRKQDRLDALTVVVEAGKSLAGADDAAREALARRLEKDIKSSIGISTTVRVIPHRALERSVGKAKRIVDARA